MEAKNENLIFRESEHPQILVKELEILRKNGEFCDVKIIVGSKSFPAHRCVLSSACAYFRIMFSSGLTECRKDEITIFGIAEDIFDMVLTYIYTGSVIVGLDEVQDLLVAANMLQISSLKNVCSNYLQNRISLSNCIGLYAFAETYDCQELEKKTKMFLLAHFMEIFQQDNEEFLEMDCEKFSQLLSSEDLKIESEHQILSSALQWLTHKSPLNFDQASAILSKVRFPLLANSDIDRCINEVKINFEDVSERRTNDLGKIEKICKNYRKLQVSVRYNATTRRGAMKFLYIIGGYRSPKGFSWLSGDSLSGTEKFDFESGKSKSSIPLMQEAKSSHAAAVVGGSIFVFGGECESLLLDIIEKYDPNSNSWTQVGTMTTPRCGFGIAVVEENVFLIGGCIGSKLTSSIDKFETKTNAMEKVGELLDEKAYFGCAVCDGNVYVSGGIDKYDDYLAATEMFDPFPFGCKASNLNSIQGNGSEFLPISTKVKSKMATTRANHSLVCLHDFLFSIGGQSNPRYTLRLVDRYNTTSDVWETITLLPNPRSHITVVVHQEKIYVIGGRDQNGNTLKSLIYFDPKTVQWSSEFALETDRCDMVAVVL